MCPGSWSKYYKSLVNSYSRTKYYAHPSFGTAVMVRVRIMHVVGQITAGGGDSGCLIFDQAKGSIDDKCQYRAFIKFNC